MKPDADWHPCGLLLVPRRALRFQVYHHRNDERGVAALAFGFRFGWWPCYRGPFVALAVGPVSLDLWWGWPSTGGPRFDGRVKS